jgi:hypothetical protein
MERGPNDVVAALAHVLPTAPDRLVRLFSLACVRRVRRVLKSRFCDALDVAERHVNGRASDAELGEASREAELEKEKRQADAEEAKFQQACAEAQAERVAAYNGEIAAQLKLIDELFRGIIRSWGN